MQTITQPAATGTSLSTQPSSSSIPEGFVKVEGGASEQVTETTSLIVAYSAIWLILMAFTLVTFRALRSLRSHAGRVDQAVRQLSHTTR